MIFKHLASIAHWIEVKMKITDKMKQDWNRRAAGNARFWVDTVHFENDEVFDRSGTSDAHKFIKILSPYMEADWRVLEVGCGIGRMMKPMAGHFKEVCGVDVSSEMISQGAKYLENFQNVSFFENNGVDLKIFKPGRFDLVYSCIAFQHMSRGVFNGYMFEINRVLRPGGFLEFQAYVGSRRDPPLEDTLTVRIYEESELLEMIKSHGFALVDRHAEPAKDGGPENWIFLVKKTADDKWISDLQCSEEECENTPPVLEGQLALQLAKGYIEQGNIPEAEKALRHLLDYDKNNVEAWFELAILHANANRGKDAVDTLKRMLDANPSFYQGYISLAELFLKMGLHGELDALLQKLRRSQSEISETLNAIERLLCSTATKS